MKWGFEVRDRDGEVNRFDAAIYLKLLKPKIENLRAQITY